MARREHWIPAVLLGLLLVLGSYFRLADLGAGEFGIDELYQVFAAQSLAQGEGPRLPSGELYVRGLDVTHLVRLSLDLLGPSELAARLPSAAFGVLGLFLFALVLWRLAGPWPAVAGTALFAVFPEAVEQSRALRFYTYQLALGVGALYTAWRTVREAGGDSLPTRDRRLQLWGWAALTLLLLGLAARAQIVTLSVIVGWGACLLAAALLDLRRHGRDAWRGSVPTHLVLAGLTVLVVGWAIRPDVVKTIMTAARSVPYWITAVEGGTTPLAYYYSLSDTYPLLLALGPLLFLAAILRRPRLGVYLTLWFVVPMALHSFWLTWKGTRFVLIPMLGLFAAAAIAIAWGGELLYRYLTDVARKAAPDARLARGAAALVVGFIALTAFVTLPALHQARKMPGDIESPPRWSTSAEVLQSRPELEEVPWGQTRSLHPLHYWGRVDFLVSRARLVEDVEPGDDGEWEIEFQPEGSPDRTSGVPVFTSPAAIREHFAEEGAVLIGMDSTSLSSQSVEDELARTLTGGAEELCRGRCGSMQLFLWRFDCEPDQSMSERQNVSASRTSRCASGLLAP